MAQGKAKELCGAKKRSGGECGKPAGWGTDHNGIGRCKIHGGSTPNQIKNVQKQVAEREARKFGLARTVDPHTALIEELHRTAGAISWYLQQIEIIESTERPNDPAYEPLHESVGGGGGGSTQEEMHVYVRALQEERKHFKEVAKTCISVGIEERYVKLAEGQADLMAQFARGLLSELGIDVTPEVEKVVKRQFTVIAGGRAA